MAKPFTPIMIAALKAGKERYEVSDGGCQGLRVVVHPSKRKSFILRFRYRGLNRKLTLGSCLIERSPSVEPNSTPQLDTPLSLAAARQLATTALREAKSGIDPTAAKRRQRMQQRATDANTLRAACDNFLKLVTIEKPMRSIDQRRADLDLICKSLGQLPIDTISREQFVHQLDNISLTSGPVRADRVQMALKRLLKWYSGRRTSYINVLANAERRISIKERARKRVLTNDELRAVVTTAEKFSDPFGGFVLFLLYTACRRNEAAALQVAELIDDGTAWCIPWQRYKTGERTKTDVLIPLSAKAQTIIAKQRQLGPYVFGATGRHPLASFARSKAAFDAACGVKGWTLHDLRRTARTLMSKAGVEPDIAERCLGHTIAGVRGVYDRHEFADEKRHAFEALAQLIERIVHPPPVAVADISEARAKRRQP